MLTRTRRLQNFLFQRVNFLPWKINNLQHLWRYSSFKRYFVIIFRKISSEKDSPVAWIPTSVTSSSVSWAGFVTPSCVTFSHFLIMHTLLLYPQGDRELEMGLPISPLCDRSVTCIPESQVGTYSVQRHSFLVWSVTHSGRLTSVWKEQKMTVCRVIASCSSLLGTGFSPFCFSLFHVREQLNKDKWTKVTLLFFHCSETFFFSKRLLSVFTMYFTFHLRYWKYNKLSTSQRLSASNIA